MELPDGWTAVVQEGPGPFVTRARLRRADGSIVAWHSRAHRKRPGRLAVWMSALFAAGSLCFAVGATASQFGSSSLETAIGVTFFVGSLLFTSAALLQWSEAVNVSWRGEGQPGGHRRWRPASWEPRRIDWLAALVQLIGTLFFNISTFAALKHGLDTRQTNLRVWAPDVEGSVCFLMASVLACAEVCGRWVCWRARSLSWSITAVNLLGSIFFGLAAIGALIEPSTQQPVAARLDNAGTALGAICFFVGAVLLVPEARRSQRATA
jgi:hypothetical protein